MNDEPAGLDCLPAAPEQVLAEGLSDHFGRPVRVLALQRQSVETSSHIVERLRATLDSGEQLPVIFKRLSFGEKLYGNECEVLIYRRLLGERSLGAPALYASAYHAGQGHSWLFLEDVGEQTLRHSGEESWLAAVRWLAALHGRYLGRGEELRALGCLGEHGPEFYYAVPARARQKLELAEAPRETIARFDRLLRGRYDTLVAHLVRQPRTLVHGDLFSKNIAVQPGRRIRPIDWEWAAVGLGAWDLTRLLDGWGRQKPAFVAAYLAELPRHTTAPFDERAFRSTLPYCDLLIILWHLRWSEEACRDAEFVNGLLDKLEARWGRLEKEGVDG